jgi:hypothetical protein
MQLDGNSGVGFCCIVVIQSRGGIAKIRPLGRELWLWGYTAHVS